MEEIALAAIRDLLDRMYALESLGVGILWRLVEHQPLGAGAGRGEIIATLLGGSGDLVTLELPQASGGAAQALFLSGLVDPQVVNQGLAGGVSPQHPAGKVAETHAVATFGQAVEQVLAGRVLLLAAGASGAIAVEARGYKTRDIDQPELESSARGPNEAFIEDLQVNVTLVRRRLRDPRLVFEPMTIGALSRTPVRLAYVRGLANDGIVAEARRRLQDISLTEVLDTNYIEESIQDDPYSLFPQLQFTERPDVVAAGLMEGRFAILADGTGNVLLAPVTFWAFLQSADDYYQRFWPASFLRLLRHVMHLLAMLAPGLYIALTTFHPQMLPPPLFLTIMRTRQGIPFPAVIEAFLMEVSIEILREAGLRLPQKLGTSLSVVGGLIIGQAAVFSGLVSWPVVVVVSITAIANFAIPHWQMALAVRTIRFAEMLAAGIMGLPGLMILTSVILSHLVSLRSFGVPYFFPVAPLDLTGLQDALVRLPHWTPRPRPRLLAPLWRRRVRPGHRPRPPARGSTVGTDPAW